MVRRRAELPEWGTRPLQGPGSQGGLSVGIRGYLEPVPMHWADAELLHQAAWEVEWARERDRHDLAELLDYRGWLIACAAVSGAEDAEIAVAADLTCEEVRSVIEQCQAREEPDENAVRRSA